MRVSFAHTGPAGALFVALAASCYVSAAGTEPAAPGVLHFHRVNQNLYRGGQPTPEGFRNLARIGIKTIIDLRDSTQQAKVEKQVVEKLGMHYVHLPMRGGVAPTDQQVTQALSILTDQSAWPVFVHCAAGRDRTGVVVACYRISVDHWTNQSALDEALREGIRSVERGKQRYILSYKPHDSGKQESSTASQAQ